MNPKPGSGRTAIQDWARTPHAWTRRRAPHCRDLRAERLAARRTARGRRDLDRSNHRDADLCVTKNQWSYTLVLRIKDSVYLVRELRDRTVVHAGPSSLRRRRSCCWLGSATQAAKQSLSPEQQAVCCGSPLHAYRELTISELMMFRRARPYVRRIT